MNTLLIAEKPDDIPLSFADCLGGIALTPTPYANVTATGSVGVGVPGVMVGLQISLVLLGLDIPIEMALVLPSFERLDWGIDINLDVYTLDGEVAFVIEIGPIEFTFTIFEWEGFHWVYDLYDEQGSIYF